MIDFAGSGVVHMTGGIYFSCQIAQAQRTVFILHPHIHIHRRYFLFLVVSAFREQKHLCYAQTRPPPLEVGSGYLLLTHDALHASDLQVTLRHSQDSNHEKREGCHQLERDTYVESSERLSHAINMKHEDLYTPARPAYQSYPTPTASTSSLTALHITIDSLYDNHGHGSLPNHRTSIPPISRYSLLLLPHHYNFRHQHCTRS